MMTGPKTIDPLVCVTGLQTASPLKQPGNANKGFEQSRPAQAPVTPAFSAPGNN